MDETVMAVWKGLLQVGLMIDQLLTCRYDHRLLCPDLLNQYRDTDSRIVWKRKWIVGISPIHQLLTNPKR